MALSFILFGFGVFVGVNIGTVICALFNGLLIAGFTKIFDKHFVFTDKFKLRKYFEKQINGCLTFVVKQPFLFI